MRPLAAGTAALPADSGFLTQRVACVIFLFTVEDSLHGAAQMTTVLECINAGTAYLEKRGVADARRNMQMLAAHHLRCLRMELYLRFDETLGEEVLAPLRVDLKKRGERIPLQHLLGSVAFHKHEFKVDSRALIPRPETEELVEWLITNVAPAPTRVLDLGCGSGVIGLSLAAAWPQAEVTLADVSPEALSLAKENAATLGLERVRFWESALFDGIQGCFDLIVANLPYVPECERETLTPEVLHDPALALFSGEDGLDLIREFCQQAKHFLTDDGMIAMEIGYDQADATTVLLHAGGFGEVRVMKDLSGVARFPLAKTARTPNAVAGDR
jgi:release factor glutamine methyltransferase